MRDRPRSENGFFFGRGVLDSDNLVRFFWDFYGRVPHAYGIVMHSIVMTVTHFTIVVGRLRSAPPYAR